MPGLYWGLITPRPSPLCFNGRERFLRVRLVESNQLLGSLRVSLQDWVAEACALTPDASKSQVRASTHYTQIYPNVHEDCPWPRYRINSHLHTDASNYKTSFVVGPQPTHIHVGLSLRIYIQTYIRGLVGWELAKGTSFPFKKFFAPRTHFLVQILVNFGENFCRQKRGCDENCGWEGIQKGAATFFADLRMNLNWTGKKLFGIICSHVLEDSK